MVYFYLPLIWTFQIGHSVQYGTFSTICGKLRFFRKIPEIGPAGAKIQTRMTDRNRTFTTEHVRYPLQLRRPRWLCESPVNPVGSVSPMRRLGVLRPGRSTQFVRTCGPIIIARPP